MPADCDFDYPLLRHDSRSVEREQRLEPLVEKLPKWLQRWVRWLHRPSSRWVRLPAGLLLIIGGLLSILPLFGLWMLPLGLLLLAQDVPPLGRVLDRLLNWLERRRPDWFAGNSRDKSTGEER